MGTLIVRMAEYRMLPNVPSNDEGKSSGSWHEKLYLYTSGVSVVGSPEYYNENIYMNSVYSTMP